ncbi:Inorganic pyrophosphatase [compost metagenome]
MCIVSAKIIGVMRMVDQGEADDKLIAVCEKDMSVAHINDISELPAHLLKEVKQFFEEYKRLENKEVVIQDFHGAEKAREILQQAITDYNVKFGK